MKNGYMMTAAVAVLTGVLAGGCDKKDAENAAKPATPGEAAAMAQSKGKEMANDKKANDAMSNMGANAAATTQKAGDMAHDAGAAMKAQADKLGDKVHSTTMPTMPGM